MRHWAGALTWLVLQGHKGLLLVFLLGWMWVLPGWLQPAQAQAQAMAMAQGWVSWVMDGDTVLLVPEGGGQALKWRLQDIDAPERCQSGGEASRDALIGLVHRQTVRYAVRAEDSYGRQIGRLERDGLDVGARLGLGLARRQQAAHRVFGRFQRTFQIAAVIGRALGAGQPQPALPIARHHRVAIDRVVGQGLLVGAAGGQRLLRPVLHAMPQGVSGLLAEDAHQLRQRLARSRDSAPS